MPEEITFASRRHVMYAIGFLFSLSAAIPAYVNSTFLAQFTSNKLVGIVYAASSLLAIFAFIEIPGLLRKFGTWKVAMTLLALEILSLAGLVFGSGIMTVIAAFLLNFVTISLISFTDRKSVV